MNNNKYSEKKEYFRPINFFKDLFNYKGNLHYHL